MRLLIIFLLFTIVRAQQYSCRCDCCNTGSASCSTSYVGTSIAYTCASDSCSISCALQYPSQCVTNQNGQTQGQCVGLITTTTTTTTITSGPWLGNTCSCMCCQSGSGCSPTYVGITSASQCSTTACTQACQARYPSVCPSLFLLGQTQGTCTNLITATTTTSSTTSTTSSTTTTTISSSTTTTFLNTTSTTPSSTTSATSVTVGLGFWKYTMCMYLLWNNWMF
ncbi:unnamed protein product [Adineta steineri]|uniref:Uncharacterized protein n=1 Tax=Adineta steineri TaxID=433720 RepID=A0A814IGJ7_9BILA|nr:unnamed protein product [Adineta steineri]CAF4102678.1 unnamed protein product [Adineta steineri]